MNYTKSKWYVEVNRYETSVESEHQTICTNVSNCDADLIAAAPDMYEALKKIADIAIRHWHSDDPLLEPMLKAINKAEGIL